MATIPAQPGYGRQFDKTHAVTVVAQEAIPKHRFVTYAGKLATTTLTNPEDYVQGVSEAAADTDEALSLVTGYSALVEVGSDSNIDFGDWIKPDGDGRAVSGTKAEHCGRALSAGKKHVSDDYFLVEVQLLPHLNITEGT